MTATNEMRGWLRTLAPRPNAKWRLFLLPHAGGGPAFFRDWPTAFGDDVELVAVQTPGREGRLSEPAVAEMAPLVDALARAIAARTDLPFAIFGHSVGALIALEMTRQLTRIGAPQPRALIVSSSRAPHLSRSRRCLNTLSNDELRDEIARLGGTPKEVLKNDEYFELMLPTLRADLTIFENYQPSTNERLTFPVLALGGQTDERTSITELAAWSEVAGGSFACRVLPGGHFYLANQRATIAAIVKDWVANLVAELKPSRVDLWCLPLDVVVTPDQLAVLSEAELARGKRFIRPQLQDRFITTRVQMRSILCHYLRVDPAAVRFSIGPYGKPATDGEYAFNLSHSGDTGLLAVGRHELGIDIEAVRDEVDIDGLAMRFFSLAEREYLASIPTESRREQFFAIWAGKEAYCKARGLGLQLPTDQYAVVPQSNAPWIVEDASVSESERPMVYPLNIAPGFAAALATVNPVSGINVYCWRDMKS